MGLKESFERHDSEYLKFANCTEKVSDRPDLCAFLILNRIIPGKEDLVSCAEHDQIWLYIDCALLEKRATDEIIANLVRCGVMYDDEINSLSMFV